MTLAEVGPNSYTSALKTFAKDVAVVSNKQIVLDDGTPAYKTDFTWRYKDFKLTTQLVSVFKEGKWVYVAAHPWQKTNNAADIVGSLSFERPN